MANRAAARQVRTRQPPLRASIRRARNLSEKPRLERRASALSRALSIHKAAASDKPEGAATGGRRLIADVPGGGSARERGGVKRGR